MTFPLGEITIPKLESNGEIFPLKIGICTYPKGTYPIGNVAIIVPIEMFEPVPKLTLNLTWPNPFLAYSKIPVHPSNNVACFQASKTNLLFSLLSFI